MQKTREAFREVLQRKDGALGKAYFIVRIVFSGVLAIYRMKSVVADILAGLLVVMISSTVAAQPTDCPTLAGSANAIQELRKGQSENPRSTAECLTKNIANIPLDGTGVVPDGWRSYLWEGASFLRLLADNSPAGSEARKVYIATELKALVLYRQRTLDQIQALEKGDVGKAMAARTEYAKGVDAESNAIWRQSEFQQQGLLSLHALLADLDPIYLLDQTAVRWVEAVRTCPNWVPVSVKALPDYAASWCPSDCKDNLGTLSDKLTGWWKDKPAMEKLISYKRVTRMGIEVAKYCGGS